MIFTFDERIETLRHRSRGLGIPLEDALESGAVNVIQVDPGQLSPGQFIHAVRMSVEQQGARVVVIDSLNSYLHAMPEERFLMVQMHDLLAYLGRRGVTTFLVVAQHGLMESQHSPVDTSYLADSVVLFRYFESDGYVHKAVSVMKKRSGAHETTIRELCLGSDGVKLSEPLDRLRGVLTGNPEERGSPVNR